MMRHPEDSFAYARRDGYEVLRLPDGEERYASEIFLPQDVGALDAMLDGFDRVRWQADVDALANADVTVEMPSFELTYDVGLDAALLALGLGPAYVGDSLPADVADGPVPVHGGAQDLHPRRRGGRRGGSGHRRRHALSGSANEPIVFRVDRPFAFTITDSETGAILCLGAVENPTA